MATLAGERRRTLLPELAQLLAPAPGRLEFALRLALICTLTTLVVEIYQTPSPALTAYVSFFVMKPDRTTSIILSIVMMLLITIVIGMVMLLAMAVIDDSLWRVTAMAAVSFILLFAASASKLRPVGAIIALIAAYALDLLGKAQIGELATRALLYVWLFVGIPAGMSILVNLVVGPSPRRLAEKALAERLRLAAAMLRGADAETGHDFAALLEEGMGELPAWIRLAGVEKSAPAADVAALRQAMESTMAMMLAVDLAAREPELLPRSLREQAAALLDEMAVIFDNGGYPIGIVFDPGNVDLPLAAQLRGLFATFAVPQPAEQAPAPAKAKGGFFLPDAFTNPAHVHYALKTTLAAMFCFITYSLLDWPGIHTSLITCYIVGLTTTGETIEKLGLRIAGCLVGAAAGLFAIVFVTPALTSIGALLALVFVAATLAAWVAAGSPRIAYAGFQIAFAFFLCVIQGASPDFDLTVARDRVIGILFGDLTVFVIFAHIWPASVASRIDPALAALLRRWAGIARTALPPERHRLAGEALAAHGTVARDLDLAGYEPASVRPSRDWLVARNATLGAIGALEAPLLLGVNYGFAPAGAAERLEVAADHLERKASGDRIPVRPLVPGDPLGPIIATRLAEVERAVEGACHAPT
jgi:multidrug resistance protein MdtO